MKVNEIHFAFSTKPHVNIVTLSILETLQKIMEEYFQYVDQTIMRDKN